jgi:hypothetical protein
MKHRNNFAFAIAGLVALAPVATLAVGPPTNVRGMIVRVDGDTIEIKERGGTPAKVHLATNAKIASVAKATLSDIKPGAFIGSAATHEQMAPCRRLKSTSFPNRCAGRAKAPVRGILRPKVA